MLIIIATTKVIMITGTSITDFDVRKSIARIMIDATTIITPISLSRIAPIGFPISEVMYVSYPTRASLIEASASSLLTSF